MPQVDLETLATISTGNDHKIDGATKNDVIPDERACSVEPDFPPDSFCVSKDGEYEWLDHNSVYERKGSTKGNSNFNHMNPSINNYNSQRSSVKPKPSIIGLPKTQKNSSMESKWRTCKVVNTRLIPKREKSTIPEAEPGSPKVSCMGRVRSKRGRRQSNSLETNEPAEMLRSGGGKQKSGFCSKAMSIFWAKKGNKKPARSGSGKVVEVSEKEVPVVVEPRRKSVCINSRKLPAGGETAADPPDLGDMTRFSSGRRSGNWAAEEINQAGN